MPWCSNPLATKRKNKAINSADCSHISSLLCHPNCFVPATSELFVKHNRPRLDVLCDKHTEYRHLTWYQNGRAIQVFLFQLQYPHTRTKQSVGLNSISPQLHSALLWSPFYPNSIKSRS